MFFAAAAVLLLGYVMPLVAAQGQNAQIAEGPDSARAMAPVDFTGDWVAVISEDWRLRMITPQKGDFFAIPLNQAGMALGNAWDPAADEASRNQCKAYGAAAIMRMPTRLRITWENDTTLKFAFDYGEQVRMVHFDTAKQPGPRTWQGHAVAEWIDVQEGGRRRAFIPTVGGAPDTGPQLGFGGGGRGGRGAQAGAAAGRGGAPAGRGGAPAGRGGPPPGFGGRGGPPGGRGGSVDQIGALQVVTTNLRPQYHRQNGVPVSQNAVVTETFDRLTGPLGDQWLIVQSTIEDPTYLTQPLIRSSHFKREFDGSKWTPTPCEVQRPPVPRIKLPPRAGPFF